LYFRPPFILEDVKGASFINVKATHKEGVLAFVLKNVTGFYTIHCRIKPAKNIF